MTLIEKAMTVQPRAPYKGSITDEQIDLVLAWLGGRITKAQVSYATGVNVGNATYAFLLNVLQEARVRGRLKIIPQVG